MSQEDKILLKNVIETYENDFLCGYDESDYEEKHKVFTDLIVGITRKIHGLRYCSDMRCDCSPESKIKSVYSNNKEFFRKMFGAYALTEHNPLKVIDYIERIVNEI